MKHFVLFLLVSFFIVFNIDVNAKVEQSLNEYKIEQLQKGIDDLKKEIEELKKDLDDTKEKKIENKKDNESLDKRIGDINFNITTFAIFITVLLLGFGFFGYRNAKADAKKEAENTTKNWLNNEADQQLNEMITKLEDVAKEKIGEAIKTAIDEIKKQSEATDLFLQGRSYHLSNEYEKAKEYYNKALDAGHTGALNNIGALYYNQGNYEKAKEYYNKALEIKDYRALNNLGLLYKEQKNYEKAEEYFVKSLEIEDSNIRALNNLSILYKEQNENEKLEKLKQKYKI